MERSARTVLVAITAALLAIECCAAPPQSGGAASTRIETSGGPSARPSQASASPGTGVGSSYAPSPAPSPSPSPSASPGVGTTFSSPLYGYSVDLPAGWTATAATMYADDPASTEDTATDMIPVPGTDTTIGILAWDLGRQTYAEWAKAFHDDTVANVPAGCDGGDPSTWPTIRVGGVDGHLVRKCNEVVAVVPLGKRVYVLAWGNRTFGADLHIPEADFETFISGVRLPSAKIAGEPLWSPSPSPRR